MQKISLVTVLVVYCFSITGCCEPQDELEYERYAPDEPTISEADVDNTGVAYASEYQSRVSKLEFTTAPAADLNGIIALNLRPIQEQPIILFHNLSEIDPEAGTATFETAPGLRTSTWGEFTRDPEGTSQTADATIDPTSGEFETILPLFDFVATIEFQGGVQTVVIPVRELTVSGALQLVDDGASANILGGNWQGHITRADGDLTLVRLVAGQSARPLTELFSATTLNYSTSTNTEVAPGTGDAWMIRAVYEAEGGIIVD